MQFVRVFSLTLVILVTDGFRFHLDSQKCEEITIPLCRRVLPYNLTRFPNLVGDRNQVFANRSVQQYSPRMHELNCSRHAVFFLCSFYAPICLPGMDESEENIKPCRSFCEQVRRDCAGSLGYWPRFAKCEELPNFSDGVCVQPESFEVVQRPTSVINPEPCQGRTPINYDSTTIDRYDYVIKFKVILIERRQNKGSIIHGKVGRVIKQNNVTIHKGRVKIWSNTESTCPSLWTGNIFLIGGYENALRRKLLLTSKSLIESWNEGTMRKIRKWQKGESNVLTKIQGRRLSKL